MDDYKINDHEHSAGDFIMNLAGMKTIAVETEPFYALITMDFDMVQILTLKTTNYKNLEKW